VQELTDPYLILGSIAAYQTFKLMSAASDSFKD